MSDKRKNMAKKMLQLPENAKVFGVERFMEYAEKHNICVDRNSYKIVEKHAKKTSMKDINTHGVVPHKNLNKKELCEVMTAYVVNQRGQRINGFLICYGGKRIRFDANEKY